MPVEETFRIVADVASALSYAHSRGMIHRDIKPSNVTIDRDDQVILTDFGIARILTGPNCTATRSVIGTPSYIPTTGTGIGKNSRCAQ